jgi:ectoine hydroxylase-related dioxygenase (phytanoyl-CoA dioxygenase family)
MAVAHVADDPEPDWVDEIRTRGHTIVRGLIPRAEADALRALIEARLAVRAKSTNVGTEKSTELTQLLFATDRTARFVRDLFFEPRVQWILGSFHTQPVIEHTKVLIKAAGAPETPWHQDHAFFHTFDPTATMISLWSPLQPVSASNGTLRILSNEPPRALLPHRAANAGRELEIEPAVLAPLLAAHQVEIPPIEPGDAVFFTSRVVHATYPNPTYHDRLAFKLVFQDLARRSADRPLSARSVTFRGLDGAVNRLYPCGITRLQVKREILARRLKARFKT